MKKGVNKDKLSITLSKEVLKNLKEFCSKAKPIPADLSPVIEIAVREYLDRQKKFLEGKK